MEELLERIREDASEHSTLARCRLAAHYTYNTYIARGQRVFTTERVFIAFKCKLLWEGIVLSFANRDEPALRKTLTILYSTTPFTSDLPQKRKDPKRNTRRNFLISSIKFQRWSVCWVVPYLMLPTNIQSQFAAHGEFLFLPDA